MNKPPAKKTLRDSLQQARNEMSNWPAWKQQLAKNQEFRGEQTQNQSVKNSTTSLQAKKEVR